MGTIYSTKQIAHNTYQIAERYPVACYLLMGEEKALLIDAGYGFENIYLFVKKLTALPIIVVNTHGHPDHICGNYYFKNAYINKTDFPVVEDYWVNQRKKTICKMRHDQIARKTDGFWPKDFNENLYLARSYGSFIHVENGYVFDLGNRNVEVIYLPGHTYGSIVLYDRQTRYLFSGDNLGNSLWIQFPLSAPLHEYVEHLKVLDNYNIAGIWHAHVPVMLPADMAALQAKVIGHITLDNSIKFIHPRTGIENVRYREKVTGYDAFSMMYVVYDKDKI